LLAPSARLEDAESFRRDQVVHIEIDLSGGGAAKRIASP
jgi:hypothetical protein